MDLNVPDTKLCQKHVFRLVEFSKLGLSSLGFTRGHQVLACLSNLRTLLSLQMAQGDRKHGARGRGRWPITEGLLLMWKLSNLSSFIRNTLSSP